MKQCPKCGFIVTDTDPSCFNCGLKFPPAEDKQHELKQSSIPNDIAQEVPEQAQPEQAQPEQPQPEQPQKYKQFCSRCGKPNTSKGKFCVVCGNSLEAIPTNKSHNVKEESTPIQIIENEYVKRAQLSSLRYRKKSHYASLTTDELDKIVHAHTLYHLTFLSSLLTLCAFLSLLVGAWSLLAAIYS